MKVSELTGGELDFWVAKALGMSHPPHLREMHPSCCLVQDLREDEDGRIFWWRAFSPTSNPPDICAAFDFAFINGLGIYPSRDNEADCAFLCSTCDAEGIPFNGDWERDSICQYGAAPIIAACRAIVQLKFGEEVEDI